MNVGKHPEFIAQSVLQPLRHSMFIEHNLSVDVLRDDLIHPIITGNKWRKLKFNLEVFSQRNFKRIVTFGGAYSNHVLATAECCRMLNIPLTIFIRNDEAVKNDLLNYVQSCQAEITFIPRSVYRERNEVFFNEKIHDEYLKNKYSLDELFFIPEGAANNEGVAGCAEILSDIHKPFDYIITACGTATTAKGISKLLRDPSKCLGISVLKGIDFRKQISDKDLLPGLEFNYDYHFGGYAKSNSVLNDFCKWFSLEFQIAIEPIYTGKSFFAFFDLVKKGFFTKGSQIVLYHSGGTHRFATEKFL